MERPTIGSSMPQRFDPHEAVVDPMKMKQIRIT